MDEYAFGQPVKLIALFADTAGAAANPTVVTFSTGLIITSSPPEPTPVNAQFGIDAAVTNPTTGRFEYVLTPLVSGNYKARVVGTGAVQGAATHAFRVLPNPFA